MIALVGVVSYAAGIGTALILVWLWRDDRPGEARVDTWW